MGARHRSADGLSIGGGFGGDLVSRRVAEAQSWGGRGALNRGWTRGRGVPTLAARMTGDIDSGRPAPEIRRAAPGDREAVVAIARDLVRSGDTYAYDPDVTDDALWAYWSPPERGHGFVAGLATRGENDCARLAGGTPRPARQSLLRDAEAFRRRPAALDATSPSTTHRAHISRALLEGEAGMEVVGMFVLRPNHPGPGAHVANASYAVRADRRGLGLGRAMGEASLERARALGYAAMQFNIVVSTNHAAVRLWRSLGFRVLGTVPGGFRLPSGERVDHHIMFREL